MRLAPSTRIVDAFSATIHADDLDALDADPDVANVSADALVTSDAAVEAEATALRVPSLETLGLDAVETDGPSGKDVGIAVIDSGLERGIDLHGGEHDKQYVFDGAPRQVAPYDDYGHGTHVAGLIGGSGEASEGDAEEIARDGQPHRIKVRVYRGVAPKARIISLKVLGQQWRRPDERCDRRDSSSPFDNRDRLKIDIINLSLGHPIYEPRDDRSARAGRRSRRARRASSSSPLRETSGRTRTRASSGTRASRRRATRRPRLPSARVDTRDTARVWTTGWRRYSSRGPDLVRRGGEAGRRRARPSPRGRRGPAKLTVRGVADPSRRVGRERVGYLMLSGTSMAAAVTSGVVALMLEAHEEQFKERRWRQMRSRRCWSSRRFLFLESIT